MRSPLAVLSLVASLCVAACASSGALPPAAQLRPKAPVPREAVPPPAPLTRVGTARAGSSVALAKSGATSIALLADEDLRALRVVSLPDGTERARVSLGARPSQIVVASDGRVFVALRDAAAVAVLERAPSADGVLTMRESARIATGADPIALALTPDDSLLLVACAAEPAIEAHALGAGSKRVARVAVARSPRALAVSADGTRVHVAHAVGSVATTVSLADMTARADDVSVARLEISPAKMPLVQAVAIATLGDRALIPGIAVATGDPTIPTRDGYGHPGVEHLPSGALRVVDGQAGAPLDPRVLARAGVLPEGCLLPRAAAADEAEGWLYVACAGPGRLFKIDAREDGRRAGRWASPARLPDSVAGLAIDPVERRVAAWAGHDAKLALVPMDAAGGAPTTERGGPARDVAEAHVLDAAPFANARGRDLFYRTNDPAIAADGRACASCHVDGADDGLSWPTPDGPRQTPMLAGRLAGTAPYGWTGARASLPEHLGLTVKRLGGSGLAKDDVDALVSYLLAMTPPPAARATELAARGRAIFESRESACATCHSDAPRADGLSHDVSSRATGDSAASFDTPSLRGVGLTAPYFHDGRYATLRELLVAVDGTMGHTKHLSDADRDALLAYLRTL